MTYQGHRTTATRANLSNGNAEWSTCVALIRLKRAFVIFINPAGVAVVVTARVAHPLVQILELVNYY